MKTICVGFDGVLNTYDGWKGDDELFQPRNGVEAFLQGLHDGGYKVVIHSTRPVHKIRQWVKDHGISNLIDDVVSFKPKAVVYIDDRAICFDGDYEATLMTIPNFHTHWEGVEYKEPVEHDTGDEDEDESRSKYRLETESRPRPGQEPEPAPAPAPAPNPEPQPTVA